MEPSHTKAVRLVAVAFWALVVLAHALGAIAGWLLLPGGFPLTHARFLANRVLPALLLASALGVAVQALRRSPSVPALLSVYPSIWFGGALAAGLAFPDSGRKVALSTAVVALVFVLGLVGNWPRQKRPARVAWLAAMFGFTLGAGFVLAQRGPEPSTHPFATASANGHDHEPARAAFERQDPVTLAPWLHVDASAARVTAYAGAVRIEIEPRLAFISRSPDRFWTVFSPKRAAPSTILVPAAQTELGWVDGGGSLRVEAASAETATIEARTWLQDSVYSHLNTYASLSVSGHRRLGLRFSPCPAQVIEVVHSEYPFGAPARLAYLDARGTFRVVQASDAEKGPFTTLAQGPLSRGEPLGMALVELTDRPPRELATIVFRDWSLQLSTELSPTAGWGLPQNALEFGRASTEPASAVYVDLTLAGTSVGRGWDSVGHAAGAYLSRLEVRVPPRAPAP